MIILDEYKVKITNLKKDIEELGKDLGIESLRARLSEIEKISSENGTILKTVRKFFPSKSK